VVYNYCLVDVYNMIHRRKRGSKRASTIIKDVINYIECDVKSHYSDALYLLFDPIPENDLGLSRTFTHQTTRQKLLADYKANRVRDPLILEVASFVKKYYAYRGPSIIEVYGDDNEADDFVEPLIEKLRSSASLSSAGYSIALYSNDLDWARYIEETGCQVVHLINEGWDSPYTVNEFVSTFQFSPTPAANTFYKALFGDTSDSILGVLNVKRAKLPINIKVLCRNYIQEISKQKLTTREALEQFTNVRFQSIIAHAEKTPFEELYLSLKLADDKAPMFDTLFKNVAVIRSQLEGKDVSPFCHSEDERPAVNDVLQASVFGVKFLHRFGRT
jgi:hypothetical protein